MQFWVISAMSDKSDDVNLLKAAKNLFDRSVEDMDAGTMDELHKRRQFALGQAARSNPAWLYYPAGAVAAVFLAVIIYTFTATNNAYTVHPDDLDMLSRAESLEFYENLEFYEWLEEYDVST